VSAILKALKKIEQESSGPARDPSISRKMDPKKALNQRARKSWLLRRLSAAFGLVLVLAAGIVLGFAYGPSFLKGRVSSPNLSDLPKDGERIERLSSQEGHGQGGDTPTGSTEKPDALKERAQDFAAAPLSPRKERPLIAQGPRKTKAVRKDTEPPFPQGVDQTQTAARPVLELQAIVWSHDPESRFAVINGHIVRANGMVEGVSVMEISQNTVSLKQGEQEWKLRMLEGD
jgi:hypothetical protein